MKQSSASSTVKYLGAWGKRGTRPGEFRLAHTLTVDEQGRVYVEDCANDRIQVFTMDKNYPGSQPH